MYEMYRIYIYEYRSFVSSRILIIIIVIVN